MKAARSILIGLTVASLLGLSGTAVASAPHPTAGAHLATTKARPATVPHKTSVIYLPFDHIHAAGLTVQIRGQVISKVHRTRGSLAGVVVKLYRQYVGNPTWVYLGSQTTDSGAYPQFDFTPPALMNAHYKVVFGGDATFSASFATTWVNVFRIFHGVISDGAGAATLSGHVSPYYTHKSISLQKRSCATCGYVTVKTVTTGVGGVYSFSLPGPPSGRWWWRVTTPGNNAFIASYGSTYSTQTI